MSATTGMSTDFSHVDYFTDLSVNNDPYPYFEWLRSHGPVVRDETRGVFIVTGYGETMEVYRDSDIFSSFNAVGGPFPGLPFVASGDDVSDELSEHKASQMLWNYLITFDGQQHAAHRALLLGLLTPKRLAENEEYLKNLAADQLKLLVDSGGAEFIGDYAQPFSLMVIADLLGVSDEDRQAFTEPLKALKPGAPKNIKRESGRHNPLAFLEERFAELVEERRRTPRHDVLTGLANATFPDGSTPEVGEVVRIATFLFAGGQETSARLLGTAVQVLGDRPDLQLALREHPEKINDFVEECLRTESPSKVDFRIARRSTSLGTVPIPAGSTIVLLPGAANRDPRQFDHPAVFDWDRPNLRQHIAFGRGPHSCPGGPLARAEARSSVQQLLSLTSEIRIDEAHHGPAGHRHYDYENTYILRGLDQIYVQFSN
jgi:cytochrome P450